MKMKPRDRTIETEESVRCPCGHSRHTHNGRDCIGECLSARCKCKSYGNTEVQLH